MITRTKTAKRSDEERNRVFIDVSHTLKSGLRTGVQRLVRNLCRHAKATWNEYEVIQVVASKGGWRRVDFVAAEHQLAAIDAMVADFSSTTPLLYRKAVSWCSRKLNSDRFRRTWLPPAGQLGAYSAPIRAMRKWKARGCIGEYVSPREGDLLLLPDAYWVMPKIWELVAEARSNGAQTATVLYDMIPLQNPELSTASSRRQFAEYLDCLILNSDVVATISETVKNSFREHLGSEPGQRRLTVATTAFPLGVEPRPRIEDRTYASVSEDVRRFFSVDKTSDQPAPFIMVGTFDPRKNHDYALTAFDKLWETRPYLKLALIGRVGKAGREVLDRIRRHPKYGAQLATLHNLNDEEVEFCYEQSSSVLFPSIAEGFGLPIIEAASHGKHVFASDIPIHREVGTHNCTFCDLDDPRSLSGAVETWLQMPSAPEPFPTIGWEQSIGILRERLESVRSVRDRTSAPHKEVA